MAAQGGILIRHGGANLIEFLHDALGVAQHPDHARLMDNPSADPRIAAAVLLDTGLARGFTATSLAALQTPVLIIAAGQPDPVQPQDKESQVVFGHLAPSISD